MSLSKDGKAIICDGSDCNNTTRPPVGLRSMLASSRSESHTADGWLFINAHAGIVHYCPECAAKLIAEGADFASVIDTVATSRK